MMKKITESEMDKIESLISEVIDAAFKINIEIGPGMLESFYQKTLSWLLEKSGHKIERERQIEFEYEGKIISDELRADLIIDDLLIVELKTVEKLANAHYRQAATYARVLKKPVALLINFGCDNLMGNFSRIVNNQVKFDFDFEKWKQNHRGYKS